MLLYLEVYELDDVEGVVVVEEVDHLEVDVNDDSSCSRFCLSSIFFFHCGMSSDADEVEVVVRDV